MSSDLAKIRRLGEKLVNKSVDADAIKELLATNEKKKEVVTETSEAESTAIESTK
jgi:hypothetical protein